MNVSVVEATYVNSTLPKSEKVIYLNFTHSKMVKKIRCERVLYQLLVTRYELLSSEST